MAKTTKEKPKEIILLAARIKQLRQDKGYTSQETFANDYGYTLSYYSRLERGEDIRFSSLIRVAEALGVTLEDFFDGMDIPKVSRKKSNKLKH